MAEHGCPWCSGRTAGEDERSQRVGLEVNHGYRLVVVQSIHRECAGNPALCRDHVGDGGDDLWIDVLPRRGAGRTDDDCDGTHHDELALDLGSGARWVERHGHGTQANDGEVGDDEVAVVPHQHRDAVALPHTEAGQAAAQGGHLFAQLAIGGLAPPADQGDALGRMAIDDVGKIHVTFPRRAMLAGVIAVRAGSGRWCRPRGSARAAKREQAWWLGACLRRYRLMRRFTGLVTRVPSPAPPSGTACSNT